MSCCTEITADLLESDVDSEEDATELTEALGSSVAGNDFSAVAGERAAVSDSGSSEAESSSAEEEDVEEDDAAQGNNEEDQEESDADAIHAPDMLA